MFAEPAALLFLITKTLRNRKPLQGLFEFTVMRRDHARQSRSELGAHRHLAFALIGEIEKLRDDLRAAFFCVELRRLQDRSIPFHETITARHFAPAIKDVIPRGA